MEIYEEVLQGAEFGGFAKLLQKLDYALGERAFFSFVHEHHRLLLVDVNQALERVCIQIGNFSYSLTAQCLALYEWIQLFFEELFEKQS